MLDCTGVVRGGTRSVQYSAKYYVWGQIHRSMDGNLGIRFFFSPRETGGHPLCQRVDRWQSLAPSNVCRGCATYLPCMFSR